MRIEWCHRPWWRVVPICGHYRVSVDGQAETLTSYLILGPLLMSWERPA